MGGAMVPEALLEKLEPMGVVNLVLRGPTVS